MRLLALLRTDILNSGDLANYQDRLKLATWLLMHGIHDYPELMSVMPVDALKRMKRPTPYGSDLASQGISDLMLGLWFLRKDLQQHFSLASPQSCLDFVDWFIDFRPENTEFIALAPWQISYLNSNNSHFAPLSPILAICHKRGLNPARVADIKQDTAVVIDDIMLSVWLKRTDLQQSFNLQDYEGRLKFVLWCLLFGQNDEPLLKAALPSDLLTKLKAPARSLPYSLETGLSELIYAIWLFRDDVQIAFPLSDQSSHQALLNWFLHHCEYTNPEFYTPADWQKPFWPNENLVRTHLVASPPTPRIASKSATPVTLQQGVNLIGFAYGELGIGEDVRMAALALEAAGIPFSVFNIAPGSNVSQQDMRVADRISTALPYNCNIFCLTGFDTCRVFLEQGRSVFDGRYNIGFWPWELPCWPDNWTDAYALVDEVWASSNYTFDSFSSNATVPVLQMPMVVQPGAVGPYRRRDFHLPEDLFLFVFSFDFNSYLARKNPQGTVHAFKAAFPQGDESVGLVIKVSHVDTTDERWSKFLELVSDEPRIFLIERTLRRDQVNALYAVCDCFISLHRAEGFGRGIAEAMLLEKPVIATNFSGNKSFTDEKNAYLVDFNVVSLTDSDYPHGQHQFWADPVIESAACAMQDVFFDRSGQRATKVANAKHKILSSYNAETVGALYRARLEAIALEPTTQAAPMTAFHPVILSGGSGTRLWPLSRAALPKQLLALLDDRTLLQGTLLRAMSIPGAQTPLLVGNEAHRFLIKEQLQQINLSHARILLEPVGRNTAPAIALAALQLVEQEPDALMLVLPADHLIQQHQALAEAVAQGIPVAAAGHLVTFGIVPTVPDTGYGYIQAAAPLTLGTTATAAYRVSRFVEKPDADTAKRYLAEGGYSWNSGIFLFRAQTYLDELHALQPAIASAVTQAWQARSSDQGFCRPDLTAFSHCPADSIDYAVMQATERAAVIPAQFAWSDVGSWDSLWQIADKDPQGNVCHGDVFLADSHNSYVRSERRHVALIGLDDVVVVETADAVLVMHRNKAQEVKRAIDYFKQQDRQEHLEHLRVYRPWGWYEGIDAGERFQVKRIQVKPGEKLSLQMHHHRAEHWIVVKGTALVTHGDQSTLLTENQSTYIPLGHVHRLENPGSIPLEIIEVQSGSYLGEDDIQRFEDGYGRN
jgi:mannose-1-phosphate guanylyltransferase/mannose-1-phosphate guanylyltransferase/mannose-6-phosphate isomerase